MPLSTPTSAVRGRFAPSPSGEMHIGNALAALLSWLQVRQLGGAYVLRMEDIDTGRCRESYAVQLVQDLRWLGLDWDEGPGISGPYGPYVQSERLGLYAQALERLDAAGRLYPCYCSRHDILAAAAAPHGLSSEGPSYPGTCRRLSPAQRQERALQKQPSLRFAVTDRRLSWHDGIAGLQTAPASEGGDFIVRRADGIYSYQLAVVVDDALMGITDVLRGRDLLDSTPRQLQLYEALGWEAPSFAHLPLLMNEDGRRLAKRHGGITLAELRSKGIPPQQITGWLAWVAGLLDRPEALSARELIGSYRAGDIAADQIVVTPAMLRALSI